MRPFLQDIIEDFDQFYSEEFSRLEEKRNYVKEIVKDLHVSLGTESKQFIGNDKVELIKLNRQKGRSLCHLHPKYSKLRFTLTFF